MELFYLPIILIVLYYAVYYYFTRTFSYWKKRNVAGPKPMAFFGNIKETVTRKQQGGLLIHEIYKAYPNEKVVGIYRMTTPTLVIRDLDIVKHIMIKDFDQFMDRGVELSKKGLGANLFHADGDTWRALRNRFTPLFTSGKLKNMYHLMEDRADKLVDYVNAEISISTEINVRDLVQKYTVSSIAACAFGIDLDTLHDKLEILEEVDRLVLTPNYAAELDMMFPGILKKLNIPLFPSKVNNFFSELTSSVMGQRGGKPSNRNDFMDLFLELRQMGELQSSKFGDNTKLEITDDMISAQTFVFYVAGYETSATTMTYLLHELAVNQDVQESLIKEIDESLAGNKKVNYDTLKDLKYLEKVFNETLRKHPIVEPLQRQARADYKIPGTDVVVKKGQIVLITPRGIHHDEKYYPNPEKFDPERFSSEVAGNRHPCAYLPFGTGPRNCIGMRFGQMQSRLCITKLLTNYRVELAQNTPKVLDIEPNRLLIGPKGAVNLKFIPRN